MNRDKTIVFHKPTYGGKGKIKNICIFCGKPLPHYTVFSRDGKYVDCIEKEDVKK